MEYGHVYIFFNREMHRKSDSYDSRTIRLLLWLLLWGLTAATTRPISTLEVNMEVNMPTVDQWHNQQISNKKIQKVYTTGMLTLRKVEND